jgi:protein-disulfide isomerase
LASRLAVLVLVALVACSTEEQKEPEPPAPVEKLSGDEVIALEQTPGSTPALTDAIEAAPAPIEGIEGTPGPSPAYGPAGAPVRVFVLADFQCPVCRRDVEPLKYLARRHPNDVRIVFKQNALYSHDRAAAAAAASIAAFRQGKFWEYHDRLYQTGALDDASLEGYAQALGLDLVKFKKDLADPAVAAQVKYEAALAIKIDLASTPGFIINGVKQMGWASYAGIESIVESELARAKKVAESGVPPSRVAYEATRQSGPNGELLTKAFFAGSSPSK